MQVKQKSNFARHEAEVAAAKAATWLRSRSARCKVARVVFAGSFHEALRAPFGRRRRGSCALGRTLAASAGPTIERPRLLLQRAALVRGGDAKGRPGLRASSRSGGQVFHAADHGFRGGG